MAKQTGLFIQWSIYLATKRMTYLMHATTWMNLENILSERGQSQKATYYMIPSDQTNS